jgi:hypothetical protein
MALKDLGRKEEGLYGCTEDAKESEKIRYPSISLPLDLVKDMGLDIDDMVEIKLVARVSGIENTEWNKTATFEAREGDVAKKEKELSLLDQ